MFGDSIKRLLQKSFQSPQVSPIYSISEHDLFWDHAEQAVLKMEIASLEHQMAFILKYVGYSSRSDAFELLLATREPQSDESYLGSLRRYIVFTKLVAPELIRLYRETEFYGLYDDAYTRLHGFDSAYWEHTEHRTRRNKLLNECAVYLN